MVENVRDLHYALRYSFNTISYDELRSYITSKIVNNDIIIPNEREFNSFMKGILSNGLMKEAKNSVNSILSQYSSFENKFKNECNIDINTLSD